MPRKITTGIVGGQVLGSLSTADNAFSSREANANIVLSPDGTGVTESTKDILISGNKSLLLSDNDSNYIGLKGNSAMSANYTLTFPAAAGSNGQALTTDASGNLSWVNIGLTVTNRTTADSANYYIAMVDAASLPGSGETTAGIEDNLSVADSNRLQFTPNPGRLTVNQVDIKSATASSSTTTGALLVAGGAGIAGQLTANAIVETSSIVYKENINPINDALDKILNLNGVTYDRKDGSTKNEAGLIAEEVAAVLPNIVSDDNDKPEGISYTKLTAYLIEAVKTLSNEVRELKSKK